MTYHVTLSNGTLHDIAGSSAAEAIGKALDRNRGLTVIDCYSGNVDMNLNQYTGRIAYDIPPHRPLPEIEDEKAKSVT